MAMALALAGAEPVSQSVGSSMGPVAFAVFLLAYSNGVNQTGRAFS